MVLGARPSGIENVHGGLDDWERDEAKLTQVDQVGQEAIDVVLLHNLRAFLSGKLDTGSGNALVSYHPGQHRHQ